MSGVTRILRVWTEPNGNYQNYKIAVEKRGGGGEYVHQIVDDTAGQNAEQLVGQVAFVQELEQISAKTGKPYKKVVAVRPAESANLPPQAAPQSSPPSAAPSAQRAPSNNTGEEIAVQALFKAIVDAEAQCGNTPEPYTAIGKAMVAWRHREQFYQKTKEAAAGKPSPQQQTPPDYGQDLNDDIPF